MAIAVRGGSISVDCPHETPIDNLDPEPAYDLARKEYAEGNHPQFRDVQELERALSDAFDNAGEECAACRKNMED